MSAAFISLALKALAFCLIPLVIKLLRLAYWLSTANPAELELARKGEWYDD